MKNFEQINCPLIFIGPGRSGTTIISEIIFKHPYLAYPSNFQEFFFKYPFVNMIRIFFENKLWKIYGQKKQLNKVIPLFNKIAFKTSEAYKMWNYLTGENIDFSRGFLLYETLSSDRINFIQNYFSQMIKFQRKKRLAFKITGPSRITFLKQIFPDANFVYLKRNHVPVISSFMKVNFWQNRGMKKIWWKGVYTNSELEQISINKDNPLYLTSIQIKKLIQVHDYEVNTCNPKILEITYENFIKNPKKIIREILKFANLEKDSENCFKYLKNIKIYNRNFKTDYYFSKKELALINKIFSK